MNSKELENIVGQLFILGFYGDKVCNDDQIIYDISEQNLGGIILFDRHLATCRDENNITGKEQVKQLTATLQSAVSSGSKPLLIAVDQEGGMVNRFKKKQGFAETPAAAELGADTSLEATRAAAAQTADLLAEMGINLNFAPVADVDIFPQNPIIGKLGRSFSSDATVVANHCAAWIDEHRKRGILTCLKHFPGHGSSRADSHHGFVDISESWEKEELQPYKILARQQKIDTVMIGHLFHRDFDDQYPATFSAKTINILRNELQCRAAVISDDMQMKAITKQYDLAETCAKSIAAGVDLVIIGNNIDYDLGVLQKVKTKILQDIEKGVVKESRIMDAWQKVQQLKARIQKK